MIFIEWVNYRSTNPPSFSSIQSWNSWAAMHLWLLSFSGPTIEASKVTENTCRPDWYIGVYLNVGMYSMVLKYIYEINCKKRTQKNIFSEDSASLVKLVMFSNAVLNIQWKQPKHSCCLPIWYGCRQSGLDSSTSRH